MRRERAALQVVTNGGRAEIPVGRTTVVPSERARCLSYFCLLVPANSAEVNAGDGIQALRAIDRDRVAGAHSDAYDRLSWHWQDGIHQEPGNGIRGRRSQVQGVYSDRLDS